MNSSKFSLMQGVSLNASANRYLQTTTMCSIRFPLLCIGLFFLSPSTAQDNFTGFWEPEIALNYKVVSDYSHNYSIRQRNYFYDDNNLQLNTRQLDISHFSKLRVRDNQSLSLGILYRFRDNFQPDRENELRLIQRHNLFNKPTTIRFGHRFRAAQRTNASQTTHRFRYRFALNVPLSGENLEIGELCLISSLEASNERCQN